MDDFSVFDPIFSECLDYLRLVLERCKEKHLVLTWKKYQFIVRERIVLGHVVLKKKIEMVKAKVDPIASLPPPKFVKKIYSFLGHAGFYRRFIVNFSKLALLLTNLLVKKTKFEFTFECLESFEFLKKTLISTSIIILLSGLNLLNSCVMHPIML